MTPIPFIGEKEEFNMDITDEEINSMKDSNWTIWFMDVYSYEHWLSNEFSPDHNLLAATHVTYCFTIQKNMNIDQIIVHAWSGHQHFCPVLATVQQLLTHRAAFHQFDKPYKRFYQDCFVLIAFRCQRCLLLPVPHQVHPQCYDGLLA